MLLALVELLASSGEILAFLGEALGLVVDAFDLLFKLVRRLRRSDEP